MHGIANQPSHAYSSLYLSDFLSFHILNNEIFVRVFCESVQARIVIFGTHVDNDVLYCGIVNSFSCLFIPVFVRFSFHTLNNEIFRLRFL